MYRKASKLFLIIALALMMVGGSFLVSMANSSAADAQNVAAADSEDNQSKSDNQDGGSDNGNNDVAGGEEITSGGGTDEVEPTINENEKNNVVEQDTSGDEKAENEEGSEGDKSISSPDSGSNAGAEKTILIDSSTKNSSVESQMESEEPTTQTKNEDQSLGSEHSDLNDEPVKTGTSEDGLNEGEPEKGIDIINAPDEYANQLKDFPAPWAGHTQSKLEFRSEEFVAPTCGTAGYYKKIVHCHACGNDLEQYKVFEPTGLHTHGVPVEENRVEPSCDNSGSFDSVVHCSVCHIELSREKTEIPALGHDMGDWKVVKEATLLENGLAERHCLREGCSHTEKDTLYMGVVEPEPIQEEEAISYTYEEPSTGPVKPSILGEDSAPTSDGSSSGSSSGSYRSRSNGSGVYTSSVSPSLPIAIESEEAADTNVIEDTPVPDIIPPATNFGSEDISEASGLISYLVLAIDILLAVGLIVGLGVLWKLGVMRIR